MTRPIVIAVEDVVGHVTEPGVGAFASADVGLRYLASADVDAHDGRGAATWTDDPAAALHFDATDVAFLFWQQQSTVRPLRDDGLPNRPLTAFTVYIGSVPL